MQNRLPLIATAALVAAVFVTPAFAQTATPMKHESMAKPGMAHHAMASNAMKHDSMAKSAQ